jgi:tellurite resistance protein TerC
MALHDFYKVPTTISLTVILSVISISILASLWKTRGQSAHEVEVENKTVFGTATDEEIKQLEPLFRKKSKI